MVIDRLTLLTEQGTLVYVCEQLDFNTSMFGSNVYVPPPHVSQVQEVTRQLIRVSTDLR